MSVYLVQSMILLCLLPTFSDQNSKIGTHATVGKNIIIEHEGAYMSKNERHNRLTDIHALSN